MKARRLVLFDIDGTILSASGISARALIGALVDVFGTAGETNGYDYSGKTDPQIMCELMRDAGISEERIRCGLPEALERYQFRLGSELRAEHVRAKPGVLPLVAALANEAAVSLGLLTGNIEPCARLKLAPLDLNSAFPFGAYGSDNADRYCLAPVAIRRALEWTGHRFDGKDVVIIGDSIHDVRCGRSTGGRAVAVATGKTPPSVLAAENPDALLSDFSDTEAALRAVLDGAA